MCLWSFSSLFFLLLWLAVRSYNSPSEEAHRRQIWLNNRRLVLVHNIMADQGIKSYRLGMTYFADMVCTGKLKCGCFCYDFNFYFRHLWLSSMLFGSNQLVKIQWMTFWMNTDFCPSSPGKWRVQTPDYPGLPWLLQRFSTSPRIYFPPHAWRNWTAQQCWLEGQGIRHWCQESEGVRLLLGLQRSMYSNNFVSSLLVMQETLHTCFLISNELISLSDWLTGGSDLQEHREAGVSEWAAAGRLLRRLWQHGLLGRPDGQCLQVRPSQRRVRHRGVLPLWGRGKQKAVWLRESWCLNVQHSESLSC